MIGFVTYCKTLKIFLGYNNFVYHHYFKINLLILFPEEWAVHVSQQWGGVPLWFLPHPPTTSENYAHDCQ